MGEQGCWLLAGLLLAGCSGMQLQAGSSFSQATPLRAGASSIASAEIMLTHQYQGCSVSAGLRHFSDVDVPDIHGGFNGVFVEMRGTLARF